MISKLIYLKSRIDNNESVDLSLEAQIYARENNITPTPQPHKDYMPEPIQTVRTAHDSILCDGQVLDKFKSIN